MADMKSYYITEINKRRKWEEGVVNHGVLRQLTSLQGFSLEEVLRKNAKSKSWFMLGTFKGSSDQAVVLLEKTAFSNESVEYLCQNTILELKSENDNFYTYSAKVPVQENAFIVTVICPAKKDCIMQYTEHERFVVTETADLYKKITIPYLKEKEKEGESRIQWVYNILDKKQESNRIVFDDPDPETGFILLPDIKWDGKNINTLCLQAFVYKPGVKSLRDLNGTHLPLLRNILENGSVAIEKKYGVPRSKLNVFIHYKPSYYYLHVHFKHVMFEVYGFEATRAHLLIDVIQNIELKDDYYQWKTLTYTIREDGELCKRFKAAGTYPTPWTR
ncbi:hypothetical protein CHS0354_038463 [Potamilus streckersoni]|uniref:m7GpppX diphosphatase n=1 Tax=Potamilus streckersoni TaxID=2493646 RepID=A0AAE0S672_9BIVA|nr:hypothetical protein CHS0354_038463 [Potamilus streckersoni]